MKFFFLDFCEVLENLFGLKKTKSFYQLAHRAFFHIWVDPLATLILCFLLSLINEAKSHFNSFIILEKF